MKDIRWAGSSKEDLSSFPEDVKEVFGFGLFQVQNGQTPVASKPLKGNLSGVYELKENYAGGTYRTVYIAKLETAVYVLHCFQKKAKSGIATPQKEIDLIAKRLQCAKEDNKKERKNVKENNKK